MAASPSRRRQSAIDVVTALVLAVLLWPFPLGRALLSVPVHVLSIVAFWQIVQIGYFALTVSLWGQTGGMRLLGMSIRCADGTVAGRSKQALWGAYAGALAVPIAVSPSERLVAAPDSAAGVAVIFEDAESSE